MSFLSFLTKYHTRIIIWLLLVICVAFTASDYTKKYMDILNSTKHIDKINECLLKATSFPEYKSKRVSFKSEILSGANNELNGVNFIVYCYSDKFIDVKPGDIFKVSGNINFYSPKTNIGGFDGINYGKSENVHGNIYATTLEIYKESQNKITAFLCNLRQNFIKNADMHFSPNDAGVVKALVTGDKTSIYESDSEAFKKSGVYHIVAISGLHLNIFIMLFANIISSLKIKRYKKALLSFFICTFVGLFVLIFTGFGLSVLRAFIMLVVFLGSCVFARKYSSKNSLFISAVTIVILIPSSFYSVGFALSVLSTLGVLISADISKKLTSLFKNSSHAFVYVCGVFVTSVVCNIITLPVTMNSFGYVSMYSPLANLIILPLMAPALGGCIIFGTLSLLGFGFISGMLAYPVSIIISVISGSAQFISRLPISVVNLYPAYTYGFIICILLLIMSILFFVKRKKSISALMAIILCVALAGNFLYNNYRTDAKIVFTDVGQGECTIAVLPGNKAVMFDFGTNSNIYYPENDIRSTLVKLNVSKLSAAFVSHFHKDHTTGLINIIQSGLCQEVYIPKNLYLETKENIFYYRQLLAACENSGTKIIKVQNGDCVKFSSAELNVLAPCDDIINDANEMSLVVKLTYGNLSFLFTGDVSSKAVKKLCEKNIDCDVLKVPHHGSKYSANKDFLKSASPEYAVISCGENNSYGHPHKLTLERLKENNTEVYRTDTMGAVIFNINKEKIKSIKTMR